VKDKVETRALNVYSQFVVEGLAKILDNRPQVLGSHNLWAEAVSGLRRAACA